MTVVDKFFVGILITAIIVYIFIKIIRVIIKKKKTKMLKGKALQAIKILEDNGLIVEDIKINAPLNFYIDGKKYCKELKIDGLVRKGFDKYIFMVKNNSTSRLTSVPNRRLLLELFTVFGTKGIIWVDTETNKLKEIIFKPHIPFAKRINNLLRVFSLIFIGFLLSYLLLKGELGQ